MWKEEKEKEGGEKITNTNLSNCVDTAKDNLVQMAIHAQLGAQQRVHHSLADLRLNQKRHAQRVAQQLHSQRH